MNRRHLILFLASGRSNVHLMAEGIARHLEQDQVEVISATMSPPEIRPLAARVMREVGIEIVGLPQRTPLDIELFMFDLVITLGDFDQACRPNLPGMPPHLHWDVPEPTKKDAQDIAFEKLRRARDILRKRIDILFQSGMLHALLVTRTNLELILDNLLDGVMAHTTSRRIFYFNQAAERITGYRRKDILGNDCHEVFPGRFCGGTCSFCAGDVTGNEITRTEVPFVRPDGGERKLEMVTTPLVDSDGHSVGALVSFRDNTELVALKQRLRHHHSLGGLVGKDPKMLALFDLVREVATVDVSVLVEGESGTGKELVANAIHEMSSRADKPMVAINCGALPEGILESELFGHVRGAFSGAVQNKKGRFELADGGTIFLDEVGELSPAMQVKLLRVLQEQRFERVGGEKPIQVDVRVISATNQNLRQLMERKVFRRDLFYRLCVVPVLLPPLRDRRLDIPMLVEHFVEQIAKQTGRQVLMPSTQALDALTQYRWPGNVRELRNAIEYAYVKCHAGVFGVEHLPPEITETGVPAATRPGPALKLTKEDVLKALARAEGNKKRAAKLLGVGRATLYRYLNQLGLS